MEKYEKIIADAARKLFDRNVTVKLSRPDPKYGDYATNVALVLAGQLGKKPRDIAEEIAAKLRNDSAFSSVEIAGAGFINVRIAANQLATEIDEILSEIEPKHGKYADQIVVTEFSDPNPFKILHIGHLYTSVVGDAISNLIAASGGIVHRVNYGGDVGLHVAKSMWSIVQNLGGELPEKLDEIPTPDRAEWLSARYVEGNMMYENDADAAREIKNINKRVYEIQKNDDHDSNLAKIYWTCRTWSYDAFDTFYAKIGVKFEKYYVESAVAELGMETVKKETEKGVYRESDGAMIFDGESYGLHTRVFINRDGLPTYEAKEVGLMLTKWSDYHFDKSIIITGSEQQEYMQVVLKSIEQFRPELVARTQHFTNGLVKLAGGIKMSSRDGKALRADAVIELVADAQEVAQGNRNMTTILGAIKFAFLFSRVGVDVIFDPAMSVSLTGNSGPYVQYAAVRVNKILKDNGILTPHGAQIEMSNDTSNYDYEAEKAVLLKLTEYPEVLRIAARELEPHRIAQYIYELAREMNRYYETTPIATPKVAHEVKSARLSLLEKVLQVFTHGLGILGIEVPDKM